MKAITDRDKIKSAQSSETTRRRTYGGKSGCNIEQRLVDFFVDLHNGGAGAVIGFRGDEIGRLRGDIGSAADVSVCGVVCVENAAGCVRYRNNVLRS